MVTRLDRTMGPVATRLVKQFGVDARLYPKRRPTSAGETGPEPTPSAVIKAARVGSALQLAQQVAEVIDSDEMFIVDGAVEPELSGELRLVNGSPGKTRFLIVNVKPIPTGDLIGAYQIACRGMED